MTKHPGILPVLGLLCMVLTAFTVGYVMGRESVKREIQQEVILIRQDIPEPNHSGNRR